MGETALVAVGGAFFGTTGRVLIVFGGLLATLSSANASIMSSSRALFALSRDRVVPEQTAKVSERFGTPDGNSRTDVATATRLRADLSHFCNVHRR